VQRYDFDALVIGGGPAGSAAARTLAAGGAGVCLVDRYDFPRDKLCGGLLTLRSRKIFEAVFDTGWSPTIETIAYGVRFFHQARLLNAVENYRELAFTCRRRFDDYLLRLAAESGTELRLGVAVRSVDAKRGAVRLEDGTTLTARIVIGADGVNSVVARSLFGRSFDPARIAFGLEMEVPIDDRHASIRDPEIHLGCVRWGYGWVFPKRATLTVGVGGLHCRNDDLKGEMRAFLRARFGAVPAQRIKGHHLPFGDLRRCPGRGHVLLCGDAAGLVDPITGEGIAYALQSGALAGHAALAALGAGKRERALRHYQDGYRAVTAAIAQANRLRYLIFPRISERILVGVMPHAQRVPRLHMDLMADEISYGAYTRLIAGRLGHAVLNGTVRRALRRAAA